LLFNSAYNQHITAQQGYTQQAQQAAQRAAQVSTNPYADSSTASSSSGQSYGASPVAPRLSITTLNQQQQQLQHQQQQFSQQHQQQQQQQQQQQAYNAFGYRSNPPSATVANPPAVHHYAPTRGRSNTVSMEVPPALMKFGHSLGVHAETGQSVTPVYVYLLRSE
jgi:hypothetical protein